MLRRKLGSTRDNGNGWVSPSLACSWTGGNYSRLGRETEPTLASPATSEAQMEQGGSNSGPLFTPGAAGDTGNGGSSRQKSGEMGEAGMGCGA